MDSQTHLVVTREPQEVPARRVSRELRESRAVIVIDGPTGASVAQAPTASEE